MSEFRQRRTETRSEASRSAAAIVREEDEPRTTVIEILRTITLLILLLGLGSWFVTRDTSALTGPNRAKVLHLAYWQTLFAQPLLLTDDELRAFDGTDPEKPIYLAINGTIYDVSNGRRFYGPGGSYHFFGGTDASRAFVTSCFDTDITPDLRNVEEAFMPKSDPEIDALFTSGEMKIRVEQERRQAKKQAYDALRHWVDFFENSPKYQRVGKVKREERWEIRAPVPTLCEAAKKARPTRKPPVRDGQ